MTTEERETLSLTLATLAEAAGIDQELLWEAAETCPQRHEDPNYGRAYEVGELCTRCMYSVRGNRKDVNANYDNPNWHPEWRIVRQARDMTDSVNLLPVVEKLYRNQPISIALEPSIHGDWVCIIKLLDAPWHYGANPGIAEAMALAFAKALEDVNTLASMPFAMRGIDGSLNT